MFDRWQRTAAVTVIAPFLAWRAERLYRKMPRLPYVSVDEPLPMLSVIVPARNEAENLRHLLPSLSAMSYPGPCEIIVVNDSSTDDTAGVAGSFGARLVCLNQLAPGWSGKPYACHQGALAARGKWLLFTDADTVHAPDGPASAVAFARQNQLDGLSLHLAQEGNSWLSKPALLAAYVGLFAGLGNPHHILNGQYILLRRDVYGRSCGFAAVRDELMEDLALGRHLHRLGYHVPMMRGETAARVNMYQDVSSIWHGLTRIGAGSLPWSGMGSLLTVLFITAAMTPLMTLLAWLAGRLERKWVVATWLTAVFAFRSWARRFGSAWWALLAPAGAGMVQLAAVWGLIRRLMGRGIHWKGRVI